MRGISTEKTMGANLILALSFSNFFFCQEWATFLYPRVLTLRLAPNLLAGLWGLLLSVLIVTLCLFSLLIVLKRARSDKMYCVVHLLLLALLLFPLNYLRGSSNLAVDLPFFSVGTWIKLLGKYGLASLLILGLSLILFLVLSYQQTITRFLRAGLLTLAPVVVLTFSQALWLTVSIPTKSNSASIAAPADRRSGSTLVLVFDEFSFSYLDGTEAGSVRMPSLERLLSESFYGANVTSPASLTRDSIPTYLTARMPPQPRVEAPLSGQGAQNVLPITQLKETGPNNIFEDAKSKGLKTAAIGWFYPYCESFGTSTDHCAQFRLFATTFGNSIVLNSIGAFERVIFDPFRNKMLGFHKNIQRSLYQVISDPGYGFIFVHSSLPHLPSIRGVSFTSRNDRIGYLENLQALDQWIGELRQRMEAQGSWDKTNVVITADHALHHYHCWDSMKISGYDERIPFIVKLANQKTSLRYDRKINSAFLRPFLSALTDGQLGKPEQVVQWLNQHGEEIARFDPLQYPCKPILRMNGD